MKLSGYSIVWNVLSLNLGGFVERVAPEAIDRTLREGVDLRALVNHAPEEVVGRMSAGTLRAKKDRYGLHVEIDAPDSPRGQNLTAAVRRQDISAMSFAFLPWPGGLEWERGTDGVPVVTVRDMLCRECSAVSWPAYPQTSLRPHNPQSATERLHKMDVAPFAPATTPRAPVKDRREAALTTRSADDGELITAMLRAPSGKRVQQTALLRELELFKVAMALAPRVRTDKHGDALVWSRERGWHSRAERPRLTVAELERRQTLRGHQIGAYR